jgi:hypothetical protein
MPRRTEGMGICPITEARFTEKKATLSGGLSGISGSCSKPLNRACTCTEKVV